MKTVITNNGLKIMNLTRADGSVQYWIGYYGLAYVPDENRDSEDEQAAVDALSGGMNELTTTGDMIYNVFQGAMTPVGLDTDIGESAAYKLFNECMYAGSVNNRYRYVLDKENGRNKLIVFRTKVDENDSTKFGLEQYQTYTGATVTESSEMPIPAPLYYFGEPGAWSNPAFQQIIDDALPATTSEPPVNARKLISADTRVIDKSNIAIPDPDTESSSWNGNTDKYSYSASKDFTYDDTLHDDAKFKYLQKFWQYQSVSNFNRFHAPTNANGYAVDYDPACRNLAKATKYFPISHYDVISTDNDNHVANVKYTVDIDLANIYASVTNRSTQYFIDGHWADPNDPIDKEQLQQYRPGFKFNRIGLYAVQVTLHAFNPESATNTEADRYNIQMQIAGNAEPELFAVMDLPSPVELTEDGLHRYQISFQLNLTNSNVVSDTGIYYNLYENDAITWYKNQLIANASAAEAVTTLGVQLNYLRQQIADMTNSEVVCGISDTSNKSYSDNFGTLGLKNLVDSVNPVNGAVRGIYTQTEDLPIHIYKTLGKRIVEDEHGVPHYADEPESTVPLFIDAERANEGLQSLTMGKDSVTLGTRSLNLTNYGVLGNNTSNTILFGGRGKNSLDKYNDNHLAVADSANSIINMDDGEISYMRGSLWMSSDTSSWVYGAVQHTIGIGHNDVWTESSNGSSFIVHPNADVDGASTENLFIGRNSLFANVFESMIVGTDRQSSQPIGLYSIFSDMDADWMAWAKAATVVDPSEEIFKSNVGVVQSLLSVGYQNKVERNISNVFGLVNESNVPSDTQNTIMVGSHINESAAAYVPKLVLTVDEYNERYGIEADYPQGDPIYDCTGDQDLVIIGTGTMLMKDGQGTGTIKRRDVKGVTLYVKYTNYTWSTGYTVGTASEATDPTADYHDFFENNPYLYADLYSTSGNLKNMLMLGDYMDAGHGSFGSILMGDYTGSRKITFKNSFANFMGDKVPYEQNQTLGPSLTMDNVWWIGSARTRAAFYGHPEWHGDDSIEIYNNDDHIWERRDTTGHVVGAVVDADQINKDGHPCVYKDAFVFRGDNPSVYGHAYWYGVSNHFPSIADWENSAQYSFDRNKLWQPVQSPMIYTGGLALGGYGTDSCNFMLMKIGTSLGFIDQHTPTYDEYGANINVNCVTLTPNAMEFSEIRRATTLQGPWDTTGSLVYRLRTIQTTIYANDTSTVVEIPSDETISDSSAIVVTGAYMTGDTSTEVPVSYVRSGNQLTLSLDQSYSYNVSVTIQYSSHKDNGKILYNVHDNYVLDGKTYTNDHFMVDSPFAGMVLMVQDKQELDGTLHVGLGKVSGGFSTAGMRTVKISTQYVRARNVMQFWVETTTETSRNLEALEFTSPFLSGTHEEGDRVEVNAHTPDGIISMDVTYTYHEDIFNEVTMGLNINPNNKPLNVILEMPKAWTETIISSTDNSVKLHGMQTANHLVMLTFGKTWEFYGQSGKYKLIYPLLAPSMTSLDDDTVRMGVSTDYTYIDAVTGSATTMICNSMEIPGYYALTGYNCTGIMRVDSNYMLADFNMNGELPYMVWTTPYCLYTSNL